MKNMIGFTLKELKMLTMVSLKIAIKVYDIGYWQGYKNALKGRE